MFVKETKAALFHNTQLQCSLQNCEQRAAGGHAEGRLLVLVFLLFLVYYMSCWFQSLWLILALQELKFNSLQDFMLE